MHRLWSSLIVPSLLSASLNGCIQFQDRPLKVDESAFRIETRTLSGEGLREFIEGVTGQEPDWPSKSWDVDRLTLAALYYHFDLALARAQAGTADVATITASQRPNPSITILPTWVSNAAAGVIPWIMAGAISIPIETAGKRHFRMEKAEHLADAAHLRISDAAWLARGRVRLAMLEAYAAQESQRLLRQQLTIQQIMTERLEQQLAAGEIARVDVIRSRLALNQLQLTVNAARKRGVESRVMVAVAIGVPVDVLSGIELDFKNLSKPPVLPPIPVQNLKEFALRERPDVLAALADYEAAQSTLQLEIANQYPNIQAIPGFAWNQGEYRWTLGADLQLPVFHHNQGPIAEAEAKRHELAVRFEALQMRILGEIERAHAGWTAVLAKWLEAEKHMRIQSENLHSAQDLFRAGEHDHLTLLGAELEGVIAKQAHLNVLVET